MTDNDLLQRWDDLLPGATALGRALLTRWDEPHRDYHGRDHLEHGLGVLDMVGAETLEYVAWWFHDAVHHNNPPWDEQASGQLARDVLPAHLGSDQVDEVVRLVLLTIKHDPVEGDTPGYRVCDADLSMIGADPQTYRHSVARLRAERPDMPEPAWDSLRIRFTGHMLDRSRLFHTPLAQRLWEDQARANLTEERLRLLDPAPTTKDCT